MAWWISGRKWPVAGYAGVVALGLFAAEAPAPPQAVTVRGGEAGHQVVTTVPAGALFGAAAVSASDAWAVGQSGTSALRTLIERWNGTAWAQVPSPSPGPGNDGLNAVAATSAANAWAVGGAGDSH